MRQDYLTDDEIRALIRHNAGELIGMVQLGWIQAATRKELLDVTSRLTVLVSQLKSIQEDRDLIPGMRE